ncbi:MAG: hypothetical protein AAGI03_04265 [Pseudomonadota bacterium]
MNQQAITINDIERVPGTTKTWRTTRYGVLEACYPGSGLYWPVRVGTRFEFSNPRILWWAADPNERRNAFYGLHHDTSLKIRDADGKPLDRRLCAHHADQATAHLFSRRRRWVYRRSVIFVTHTIKPFTSAFGRFFHGRSKRSHP